MATVLTLLLSHQRNSELARVLELWERVTRPEQLLVAYGGEPAAFEAVTWPQKFFVADPRLRTRDHPRERQSYTAALHGAGQWLRSRPEFDFVHFVEFDHVPVVANLHDRMLERLREERADVLAFHLQRIDGTNHPHYLHHAAEPRFHQYLAALTKREDSAVVLSMLGTGSFWTRDAFEAVGGRDEPFPIYNEIYIPTTAHHLGFRLRDMAEQGEFVHALGDRADQIADARRRGAWTLHPVKTLPTPATIVPG